MAKAHGHVVSVLLTDKQFAALKKYTKKEGRPQSNYIRLLVSQDLKSRGFDVGQEDDDDEVNEETDG